MRAVVTRVSSASVSIDGATVGAIGTGFLVLLGIGPNDTQAQAEKLAVRDCALARAPGASGMTAAAFARIAWAARKRADCRVTLRCYSPGGAIAPAPTVYITIGRGEGHNWWGALYPQAAALTAEETGEREAEVVWPLWDWLRGVLTGWGIMW